MKKLIITSILFLLTITTTFADCKTETSKKEYWLDNLKPVILNIWEKIVDKSDNKKVEKLIWVLGGITTKNKKQEGIINLLKDYFECEIDWNDKLYNIKEYKSIYDEKWGFISNINNIYKSSLKFWLEKPQHFNIPYTVWNLKYDTFIDNYSYSDRSKNKQYYNWFQNFKIYFPPWVKFSSLSISWYPTNSYINLDLTIIWDWNAMEIDHLNPILNKEWSVVRLVPKESKTYRFEFYDGVSIWFNTEKINKLWWAWVYIDLAEGYMWTKNPSVTISSHFRVEDREKFNIWLNNKNNFLENWNPPDKVDKIKVIDTFSKWIWTERWAK